MHKDYIKIVKAKFGAALQAALPEFYLSRLQRKANGGRLYQSSPRVDLTLFIILIIHDNADEFNLNIGFSRDGLCPEEAFFLSPVDTLALPPEEFTPKIDALIADAVKELKQYAVPYFETLRKLT